VNPPRPSPALVVFALWLLVFSSSSQTMIMAPILPLVGSALGIREALLGTLVSAYSLMVGLFALVAGPFSDRVGRRRILLAGTGMMTFALVLHFFVEGYLTFLAVRLLAGTAGGILSGSAVSYVGDYFPDERRGWATGWVMSGWGAGQILGIPLGVVLAGWYGFRAPFYLFALVMAVTFALVLLRLPQPDVPRSPEPVTLPRAIRAYTLLLGRSEVVAAVGAFFLTFFGLSLYAIYLPTWLGSEIGATANQIAIVFLVGGIANVLVGPQAGRLSDRLGRKGIIVLSCAGMSVVMALTTWIVRDIVSATIYFFLVMGLVAMRVSPFSALLTALVEDERRGTLLSLNVAMGQVGFALGGVAAGLLFAGPGYGSNTLLAALSVIAMGIVVWLFVPEPGRGMRLDADVGGRLAEGDPGGGGVVAPPE
jgi:predicted MFS family arabinose efflux permease